MTELFSLLSNSSPRYQQVTAILQRDIQSGLYPVGSLLPPEPQLCQQFAVSRHTVREAVRALCDLGLVTRHQGVGTRVRAKQTAKRFTASLSSLRDLMEYTKQTRLKYLGCAWVDAEENLAKQLTCETGERWLELNTIRYSVDDGAPIVHMRVYVRPECDGMQHDLEIGDAWVYGLVEKYGGQRILQAEQIIGAVGVPESSAQILGVQAHSPGLWVRRYYLGSADRLLSVSLNVYPLDRFEFATRWRLEADISAI